MKQIERTGVRGVRQFFEEKLGWFFREQTQSDWGIDAHVEVADDEKPLGKLFGVQIKSGASYFKESGDHHVFHGRMRHSGYIGQQSCPISLQLAGLRTCEGCLHDARGAA